MATVVPLYSVADSALRLWPELTDRIRRIAAHGVFTDGPTVAELEAGVARFTGAAHAVAVNSGTDALVIMMKALGIGPGDEVVVPSYTFFATASAVSHCGAKPVFVDILPGSYAMDPDAVEAAITERTSAIMPVHLFSQMADMVSLREIATRHQLHLIEDSAEGVGMRMDGTHAGLWGAAGVLSFFPTKTLGAFGDGGMLLTDDGELADRARAIARGTDPVSAWRSELDEIQAAVLLERLRRLPDEIQWREELAARYTENLGSLAPRVVTPYLAPVKAETQLVFYVYLIEADRRDDLAEHLRLAGVETETYYPRPINEQPCFDDANAVRHPTPNAKAASDRALALPLYADLTMAAVDEVCSIIRRFYAQES